MVLAGGRGTRLRPLTYSVPKQLIPVGGRPVLGHVLVDVMACGIEEAVIVTSPESVEPVEAMLATGDYELRATVVLQGSPDGLAAAYGLALPHIGDDSSLLYLGDCLVTGGVGHLVAEHVESGADATILVTEVDDPSRYGIVEQDDHGRVTSLVEKPVEPRSNLGIVGVYAFNPSIAESVAAIGPSARGEYEITDAIQHLVDRGGVVRSSPLRGWWVDTGTLDDVVAAHRRLMEAISDHRAGTVIGSELIGSIVIAEGSRISGSKVVGPTVIDRGVEVVDSEIGPFTHLGRHSRVRAAHVSGSIVMEGARVEGSRLTRSIIGPRAIIEGDGSQSPLEAVLGSDARLSFSHEA